MARVLPWLVPIFLASCASAPDAPKVASPEREAAEVLDSIKPTASGALERESHAKLEAYLERVLIGRKLEGKRIEEVELVQARLFEEGHINETWYLAIEIDGHLNHAALKLYADPKAAERTQAQFDQALSLGWPVPRPIVRGDTEPYSDKQSLLMEFIVGPSLRRLVEELFADPGASPRPEAVAAGYAEVAQHLGLLHRKNQRPRRPDDPISRPAFEAMLKRCAAEGWCTDAERARLAPLAAKLDAGPVTFCHGDLYETQVILTPAGKLQAFVDLDFVGYADPASDLGSLLAHVLLVNPAARSHNWGIPNPSKEEQRVTAAQILDAYRKRAKLTEAEWPGFVERARTWAWLRLGDVMVRYRSSQAAEYLLEALRERQGDLLKSDPFEELGLLPK